MRYGNALGAEIAGLTNYINLDGTQYTWEMRTKKRYQAVIKGVGWIDVWAPKNHWRSALNQITPWLKEYGHTLLSVYERDQYGNYVQKWSGERRYF